MILWSTVFFLSCFVVFYNYAGYAIIVFILNKLRKPANREHAATFYPSVSFIVAAYNEEEVIEGKILNTLQQNYPADKVEFIFITDGSTDETPQVVTQYSTVKLLHEPKRRGKSAALNRAVERAQNDVIIISDANTILNQNAILNIVQHYRYEDVGGVAGEKKVMSVGKDGDTVGEGEGFYWRYESFLKKLDSDFYSVVGAAGELFSFRKKLYQPMPDSVILDDFVISMKIAQKGYRIVYEPDALAMETPSFSIKDEQKRKIRIAAGGFQAIAMLPNSLMFWKHFKLSFLYISHRVLRWTLTPLCLITALASNIFLLYRESIFFEITFMLQVIFYTLAIAVKLLERKNFQSKFLKLPYYFVFMNVSVILGFIRYITKGQASTWEKAKRAQVLSKAE